MIVLIGASAITLAALQASINAPTESFRHCLKEASTKAATEKVPADGFETYVRNACSVPMSSLKSAVIAFRTKNGMARKAAAEDADMTVDDYVGTSVDKYQFMESLNTQAQAQAAPAAPAQAPAPTPASISSQPPKQ